LLKIDSDTRDSGVLFKDTKNICAIKVTYEYKIYKSRPGNVKTICFIIWGSKNESNE